MRLFLLAVLMPGLALAQGSTELETVRVAPDVHMLVGPGGNVGVVSGADATFLIDDKFAPLTPAIEKAVAAITPRPTDFVLNTHWHGDHTGGNERFGESGALIVAHHNVRERMATEQIREFLDTRTPPSAPGALPVVTFNEDISFHINGMELRVIHAPRAHTDGDSVVFLRRRNVVHAGDVFFNGRYPFIDVDSGGTVQGLIVAVEDILTRIDADTLIIPGHGPLGDRASLEAYRNMLATVRDRVQDHIEAGHSIDEVLETRPTADFDEEWTWGFIDGERFTRIMYHDLSRRVGN